MTTKGTRRNFFGLLFGGWLVAASGLKASLPKLELPPTLPVAGNMWKDAMPITEVERKLFVPLKTITEEVMEEFYRKHTSK